MAARPKAKKPAKSQPRARSPAPKLRRVPSQERSRARLERILDAADAVFAEAGYQAATMEDIASRAETSIGSLYQFFPNKPALFSALQRRYLDRSQELFESLATMVPADKDWRPLLRQMIDTFWQLHCDLPGFRAVWVHGSITAEMLAAGDAVNVAIAERVATMMAFFAPKLSLAKRQIAASVLVETISALLFVAVRRERREGEALVAETKFLCESYLEAVLERGGMGHQG